MSFYTDIDFSFTKNSFTGDINIVKDSTSIKQSIKNILLTFPGERSFIPKFGVGLERLLFENGGDITSIASFELMQKLSSYENRIKIQSVTPTIDMGNLSFEVKYEYFIGGDFLSDTVVINSQLTSN